MTNFYSPYGEEVVSEDIPEAESELHKNYLWNRTYANTIPGMYLQHIKWRSGSSTFVNAGEGAPTDSFTMKVQKTKERGDISLSKAYSSNLPTEGVLPNWNHSFARPIEDYELFITNQSSSVVEGEATTTFMFPDGSTEDMVTGLGYTDIGSDFYARKSGLPHAWRVTNTDTTTICMQSRQDAPVFSKSEILRLTAGNQYSTSILSGATKGFLYVATGLLSDLRGGYIRRFEWREYDPTVPYRFNVENDCVVACIGVS